jgi:hypothetical protein
MAQRIFKFRSPKKLEILKEQLPFSAFGKKSESFELPHIRK